MTRKYPKIVDQSAYLAKILIVDEIGLSSGNLVSGLLSQGYLVYLSTTNPPTNEALVQNHNLYLIPSKEIKSLTLIDYLIVIQKPGFASILSNYPLGYKTIVFRQWSGKVNKQSPEHAEGLNQPASPLSRSVQTVFYEEIIDPNVINKFNQLVNLRKSGNQLILKEERKYYPIFPITVGQTIPYLINQPHKESMLFLSAGEYSWTVLINQINSASIRKTKKRIDVSLPLFTLPNMPIITFSGGVDLLLKKEINYSQPIDYTDNNQVTKIQSRHKPQNYLKQLRVVTNKIQILNILRTNKLVSSVSQNPTTVMSPAKNYRLATITLVVLLLFANFSVFSHFVLTQQVNRRLSQLTTALTTNNIVSARQELNWIKPWKTPPLAYFIDSTVKDKIPSSSEIDKLISAIVQSRTVVSEEQVLLNRWRLGERVSESDWDNMSQTYQNALTALNEIRTTLNPIIDQSSLFSGLLEQYTKMDQSIELAKLMLTDEPKKLLLLIQNNYELRPTGGLVSAYGIVTFQNGQIPTWEFFDSSILDRKMTGKIQPPVELVNQLGETQWFFRDINWEPDVALTAEKAIWYYETAEKTLVDGALLVDANFLQKLYVLLNPSTNSKEESTFYTELISASTKNKQSLSAGTFLADYADKTLNQLIKINPAQSTINQLSNPTNNLIYDSFETKNLSLYLKSSEGQTVLAKLGWDGKIKRFIQPASKNKIIADYLMINEANTGINLVNSFIERQVNHEIKLLNSQKESTLTMTYNNNSSLTSWPGGEYQAYIRLFLPKSIGLHSFSINNGNNFETQDTNKLNGGQFDDKSVFGFRINVPPGKQISYQINYVDQGFSAQDKIGTYLLLVQKQPGVNNQRYQLSITSDKSLTPLRSIPDGQLSNNTINVISGIEKDTIFQVDFGQ